MLTLSENKLARLANRYARVNELYGKLKKEREKLTKDIKNTGESLIKSSTYAVLVDKSPRQNFSKDLFIEEYGEEEYNRFKVEGETVSLKVSKL